MLYQTDFICLISIKYDKIEFLQHVEYDGYTFILNYINDYSIFSSFFLKKTNIESLYFHK